MSGILLVSLLALIDNSSSAPYYTPASIANTAAAVAGYYAPNTFVTVYGVNLAFSVASITADDISGGILPTALPGTGVRVLINQIGANLWYVSPNQINLLIPNYLAAGPATLQIEVDGLAGPAVPITLSAVAPAMYQTDGSNVLAFHLDGSKLSAASPAQAGEVIVIYATGLGPTLPQALPNQVPPSAAPVAMPGFEVWLDGTPVDPALILYAGVTPGYAGLYQVNLTIPSNSGANPEIRIGWTTQMSPPGVFLPLQ